MINWIKNKIFSKYTRRHGASDIIPNGTLLSKDYRIEKFIGSGGFSDVYLARHTKLHTKHAVKVIKSISFPNHKLYELFIQEAKVLYRLRHDSVVRYEGFSQDEEGRYFLVMEFVDGPTLTKVYRKRPLSVEEIYVLRDRLAGGLIAAHDLNIIHRDISPANVILPGGKIEKAKLIDFGISKLANPGNKESIERHFFGKYRFASPEQIGVFPAEVGKPF
jgi:eukaryotic-like serine/threonine-protein kinase